MKNQLSINTPMNFAEWAMLITLSVLWGGSFFFVEIALRELPPFTVVWVRVGLAAALLWVGCGVAGIKIPTHPRIWGAFFIMGFLNNVAPFSLIVWGQTQITSGLASILNATTPLFTVVVAHFLTCNEKMTVSRLCGVMLGFGGVALVIGPSVLTGLGKNILAQGAVLVAAFSYAAAGVYGRRFHALPPLVTAAGQVTAATVWLLPLVLVWDRPWNLDFPHGATLGALLALAGLSTALAYLLYFRILSTAGATNLLLVTFLIPVGAIFLGTMVLEERLAAHQLWGLAMIGLALAAMDGRPLGMLGGAFSTTRPTVP